MKRTIEANDVGAGAFRIFCEGCRCDHYIYTQPVAHCVSTWKFNGDMLLPTFSPSVKIHGRHLCHFNVTAGEIHWHADSTHELANTHRLLPEL